MAGSQPQRERGDALGVSGTQWSEWGKFAGRAGVVAAALVPRGAAGAWVTKLLKHRMGRCPSLSDVCWTRPPRDSSRGSVYAVMMLLLLELEAANEGVVIVRRSGRMEGEC